MSEMVQSISACNRFCRQLRNLKLFNDEKRASTTLSKLIALKEEYILLSLEVFIIDSSFKLLEGNLLLNLLFFFFRSKVPPEGGI